MNIKQTTAYIPVDHKTELLIAFRERISNNQTSLAVLQSNVEKRTGVFVLTQKEIEKLIGEAFNAGEGLGCYQFIEKNNLSNRFSWVGGLPESKAEYINNILNKAV